MMEATKAPRRLEAYNSRSSGLHWPLTLSSRSSRRKLNRKSTPHSIIIYGNYSFAYFTKIWAMPPMNTMYKAGFIIFILFAASPAAALCIFAIGNSCSLSQGDAKSKLIPVVNRKVIGSYEFIYKYKLGVINYSGSDPAMENNKKKLLLNASALEKYINNYKNCKAIDVVWKTPLISETQKQKICGRAQIMKGRGLIEIGLSIGKIQPSSGLMSQEIHLVFFMTEKGVTLINKYFLGSDSVSVKVATRYLNFMRILTVKGDSQSATVAFQYEEVPNVWSHVEQNQKTDVLGPIRKTGQSFFAKDQGQWSLVRIEF